MKFFMPGMRVRFVRYCRRAILSSCDIVVVRYCRRVTEITNKCDHNHGCARWSAGITVLLVARSKKFPLSTKEQV